MTEEFPSLAEYTQKNSVAETLEPPVNPVGNHFEGTSQPVDQMLAAEAALGVLIQTRGEK